MVTKELAVFSVSLYSKERNGSLIEFCSDEVIFMDKKMDMNCA